MRKNSEQCLICGKTGFKNSYRWVEDREQRFAPYTEKFRDQYFRNQIKKEQKNIDPITEDPLSESANLHHIDYDKQNDERINLIFLNKKSSKIFLLTTLINNEFFMYSS